MRLNHLVPLLPLVGSSLAQRRAAIPEEVAKLIPKKYIVEYSHPAALRKRQDDLDARTDVEVIKTFESDVFSGVSIETDDLNADALLALPDVVRVWPNRLFERPKVDLGELVDKIGGRKLENHGATGVDKLHQLGIYGKGAKVGVVDTGIYYNHSALGGGFGEGFKVVGGYDLVGDDAYPETPPVPDEDPNDGNGHGTHVAGIVAGQTANFSGVAPQASLYAYKVFSAEGGTSEDVLIDAFLRAYSDGVDIITCSVGGSGGWAEGPWAEVASRLVDEGVVVTISAANAGAYGPFFASSGSSGKNVLAIASAETDSQYLTSFRAVLSVPGQEPRVTRLPYAPGEGYFPPEIVDWPIVPLSLYQSPENEACDPLPNESPDFTGTIALVRRGGCTFSQKQQNLEAKGAKYILIYTNELPVVNPSTDVETSLIALTTAEAGAAIIEVYRAGGKVTADFSVNPEDLIGFNTGNKPSDFTQWGGLYDLQVKPDVAGPGSNILSAYIGSPDNFQFLSGTSMACPYIAGVAALWIGEHGGRSVHGKGFAKELHQRIVSSGTPLPWLNSDASVDKSFIAPPLQVGSGLVDAWKVVKYDTRLEFETIALNDTRYFSRYHDVTVHNEGNKDVTYSFLVQNAAGVEVVGWLGDGAGKLTKRIKIFAELEPTKLVPEVSLPRNFTLGPGKSKTVSINFKNPDTLGWNASALPIYGGNVIVSASNGERLAVPFSGLAADLKRELDHISEPDFPYANTGVDNVPWSSPAVFGFNLSLEAQDYPKINNKLIWGSREIRWDIYEAGWKERQWKYPPVVGENGYVGSATFWTLGDSYIFDPDTFSANDTFSFPYYNEFRTLLYTESYFYWFGKLANGTQIPDGRYAVRFAVLKPFGEREVSDGWQVLKTPEIVIKRVV